ncbi:MAG TPA: hypothetical protein PLS03_16090 [Terrimicrobiaceae bacterium]|nr:hypothetical protein [Terrimicrobiaceae bacterium]
MAKDAGFWYQNLPADPNRAKNRFSRGGAIAEQGFCIGQKPPPEHRSSIRLVLGGCAGPESKRAEFSGSI